VWCNIDYNQISLVVRAFKTSNRLGTARAEAGTRMELLYSYGKSINVDHEISVRSFDFAISSKTVRFELLYKES
jgi:hypothetical protein